MTDQERLELMLEYAAGALEPGEAERVRAGLASGDPGWAAAKAEAEATLVAYAGALEAAPPPASTKSGLMSRVAREQDALRRHKPIPGAGDPHRAGRRLAQWFTALAAMILIAVLVNVWTAKRIDDARQQVRKELEAEILNRDATIQILNSMIERDQGIRRVLDSAKFKVVDLGSDTSKAVGRILIDQETRTWHVFAAGLQQQPADKIYELWYITPDQSKIPAGVFNVDPRGAGSLTVKVPADLGPVALAAITDEQAPQVQVPAGSIHLSGALK